MSGKRKVLIGGAAVLVGAALALLNLRFARAGDPEVDVERIARRNLAAIVSASGTVEPQLAVDISSSVMGRVTRLAVAEGERVAAGQLLLQIDPESLRAAVDSGAAALRAAESGLDQARVAVETARVNLERAREQLDRQQDLWELRLVSRDDYDQARRDVELRETEFRARTVEVATAGQRVQQEQALLDSAEYDLSQVTITSPIDGVVTRRNIEEGETVVIGTMNNPGTVLMTIADFSILEAHVEVDETDIPSVRLGQPAEITVDALPGRTYRGLVTEIGNSPLPSEVAGSQATNFRVVVTLDDDVPGVRPGFTAKFRHRRQAALPVAQVDTRLAEVLDIVDVRRDLAALLRLEGLLLAGELHRNRLAHDEVPVDAARHERLRCRRHLGDTPPSRVHHERTVLLGEVVRVQAPLPRVRLQALPHVHTKLHLEASAPRRPARPVRQDDARIPARIENGHPTCHGLTLGRFHVVLHHAAH